MNGKPLNMSLDSGAAILVVSPNFINEEDIVGTHHAMKCCYFVKVLFQQIILNLIVLNINSTS